jgi:hypothetical protein
MRSAGQSSLLAALLIAAPLAVRAQCASPIAHADIVGAASAVVPFARQSGYGVQVYGTHTPVRSVPESGIHGAPLPQGETLRFGKTGNALAFQVHPADPTTSGGKRAEITFGRDIEPGKVYWIALSLYVQDWGRLERADAALFGTQLHSGDDRLKLSPAFGLFTSAEGRKFKVQARWSTSDAPQRPNSAKATYAERALPFQRWIDFVFRFRLSTTGAGFLQVWMDGERIVEHRGNLGYNTPGRNDYVKFGYYSWSAAMSSARKLLVRSPTIVADPTGAKYGAADLRALLRCAD